MKTLLRVTFSKITGNAGVECDCVNDREENALENALGFCADKSVGFRNLLENALKGVDNSHLVDGYLPPSVAPTDKANGTIRH